MLETSEQPPHESTRVHKNVCLFTEEVHRGRVTEHPAVRKDRVLAVKRSQGHTHTHTHARNTSRGARSRLSSTLCWDETGVETDDVSSFFFFF